MGRIHMDFLDRIIEKTTLHTQILYQFKMYYISI